MPSVTLAQQVEELEKRLNENFRPSTTLSALVKDYRNNRLRAAIQTIRTFITTEDPRSVQDHRRLNKIITLAFDHWPATHAFQPTNRDHLRAWLCIKAGYYREEVVERVDGIPLHLSMQFAVRVAKALHTYGVLKIGGTEDDPVISVLTPKSMKFSEMRQRPFNELRDRISNIIVEALGISIEDLLRHGGDAKAIEAAHAWAP
jgi:hypothetical protein